MKKKPGQDTTLSDFLASTTDKMGSKLNKMELISHQGGLGQGSHRNDLRGEITLGEMITEEIGDLIDPDDTLPSGLDRQ